MEKFKEFMKKYGQLILIAALIVVIVILAKSCSDNKKEREIWDHNYHALQDSVHYYEMKNGELIAVRDALIIDKDELSKYLDMSMKEIKELEKALNGALALAGRIETVIKYDTIRMTDSIWLVNDSIYSKFKYNDQWTALEGSTVITDSMRKSSTTIDYINMNANLKVGMTDNYKFYATSDNPYLKIGNIESAVIDENMFKQDKKKWGLGVYAGFGASYGIINRKIDVGPSFGVSVNYNLFQW